MAYALPSVEVVVAVDLFWTSLVTCGLPSTKLLIHSQKDRKRIPLKSFGGKQDGLGCDDGSGGCVCVVGGDGEGGGWGVPLLRLLDTDLLLT